MPTLIKFAQYSTENLRQCNLGSKTTFIHLEKVKKSLCLYHLNSAYDNKHPQKSTDHY